MTEVAASSKHQKAELGFWLYLMTDIILFASLFATYIILRPSTAGGPSSSEVLEPHYALLLTVALLISSFTCGVAVLALRYQRTRIMLGMMVATIALGATFLLLELSEFSTLLGEGHSWRESAFLSSFFTLVGTHGLHITIGLIWAVSLTVYLLREGKVQDKIRKLTLFSLFWHFLDLVWIFIFTIVYLGGQL